MHRLPNFLKWLVGSLLAIAILTGLMLLQNPKSNRDKLNLLAPLNQISATPETKEVQTLLVEITDNKQQFVVGALLIRDGQKSMIAAVDPNVVVDLRLFGLRDLHSATNQVSTGQIVDALNVASGLDIEGVLNLTQIGLGALLDEIGGLTVQTPISVTLAQASDDSPKLLRAGKHKLDGATAAAYAVFRRPGESVIEQSKRFRPVLTAALDSLPRQQQAINARLNSLGQSGSTNLTDLDIAGFLAQTRGTWETADTLILATEPSQLRAKAKPNWLWLNTSSIYSTFLSDAPGALWSSDSNRLRVTVSSRTASERLIVRKLLSRGTIYFVDGGSTAPALNSRLIVTETVPKSLVSEIKKDLSLPNLEVQVVSQISTGTDMQLDLGEDFNKNQNQESNQ